MRSSRPSPFIASVRIVAGQEGAGAEFFCFAVGILIRARLAACLLEVSCFRQAVYSLTCRSQFVLGAPKNARGKPAWVADFEEFRFHSQNLSGQLSQNCSRHYRQSGA